VERIRLSVREQNDVGQQRRSLVGPLLLEVPAAWRPHLSARLCNQDGLCIGHSNTGRGDSDLSTLSLDSVQDRFECGIVEATVHPCLLVPLESRTQPLRAVIESIAKGLMYALKRVSARHEDLRRHQLSCPSPVSLGHVVPFRMRWSMPVDAWLGRWVYWTL